VSGHWKIYEESFRTLAAEGLQFPLIFDFEVVVGDVVCNTQPPPLTVIFLTSALIMVFELVARWLALELFWIRSTGTARRVQTESTTS